MGKEDFNDGDGWGRDIWGAFMLKLAPRFFSSEFKLLMIARRALSSYAGEIDEKIGEIYNKLVEQAPIGSPIKCNFISDVVDHWAKQPSNLAIRSIDLDNGDRKNFTYKEIAERSQQVAQFFDENNIKKGDAVALMLGQRSAWWYFLAGAMRQGIAAVPCPRLLTSEDLRYRINDLNIRAIVTAPELETHIDKLRNECSSLVCKITTGKAHTDWYSTETIFSSESNFHSVATTTTNDPCVYLYTSGTTGQPKAVVHHQDYPFFHWTTGRRWLRATPNDLVYNASDTGWGFTVWTTTATWAMGAQLLITPTNQKFDPQKILAILRDEPVSIFCAAPTVLRLLVAQPNFDSYHFNKLKRIATVGEALDETVINRFASKGVETAVGFGQAETPLLIGRVDEQAHVPGTMGRAIHPYKIAILDEELQSVSPGNVGQIAVDRLEGKKGGLMRGYANAPEKTQKVFSSDGRYYLTGDYAKCLSNGLFAYQGRKDDLMKSHGYRIGPDEVEKAGMSHPAVAKIAVISAPTAEGGLGRTVKAFILLKPGMIESDELIKDIQNHIKKQTAPYKYPRLIEFLPLHEWQTYETTSGKIRRAGLRAREENKLNPAETSKVPLKR